VGYPDAYTFDSAEELFDHPLDKEAGVGPIVGSKKMENSDVNQKPPTMAAHT
jgi:hypothetical protein